MANRRFRRVPGTTTTVMKRSKPIAVKAGVRTTRTVKLSRTVLKRVLARTHLRFRYTLTDAAGNRTTRTFTHRLRTIDRNGKPVR